MLQNLDRFRVYSADFLRITVFYLELDVVHPDGRVVIAVTAALAFYRADART